MADSKEAPFQQDIIAALAAQGWLVGEAKHYDRANALYPEDLLGYVQHAWPDRWEKFCKLNPQDPAKVLVQKVVRELEQAGTLDVLRHGVKVPGVKLELCSFAPDHGMNPEAQARYAANRLRVVPELSYSPHFRDATATNAAGQPAASYNPRLDLVLFVNGLPVATLELKSEFKQSVDNAKRQYRYDRPSKDPLTRKPEPLLSFKRGALVHFAVSQFEVAMTTQLAGIDTFFLPFNRGTADGGAGNPPAADEHHYATAYLWDELLQPALWLKVLGRFLHLQKTEKEDDHGNKVVRESLIFPRYHQLQAVNRLIAATQAEGAGKRYLVQHSAGSGKSNSIAWLAHQLASLYAADGSKLFNSVIVITDRTVLDSQLQQTIYQFEHAQGVVQPINREVSNDSKSQQLAQALQQGTRIIIVTLQTFPALYSVLEKDKALAAGRYAVIADEAHSSQTGASAGKLKAILGSDGSEVDDPSAEDLLDAAVAARQPNECISYYAFTATPKAKTLELFGRPPNAALPPSSDNKPEPFHVYSMRQAIEEGFILDVLHRYVTYKAAWKLAHPHGDDEVDLKQARTKLARWVRLHPHNIGQKVEVIVEHFRAHVRALLGGEAKAMVVTGSRQEAVRYQLAVRDYVKQQGYGDVHPLVAFSGSVLPDDVIPQEVTETSALLNPGLNGRDHAKAFDTQDFNVLIVANKYQTGFDQPKLCAMYVDKKLNGVDCVQTLSRLNRLYAGKETFILDFFNEPQDILDAFLPYYNKAELADVSDPQLVYDLQKKLDAEGIYYQQEVEQFALAFFDPKSGQSKLTYYCQPARERFTKRYQLALSQQASARDAKRQAELNGDKVGQKQAEHDLKTCGEQIDQLDLFRKNLISFVRLYEFLSQIVPYDDRELEQLCVFARHLYPLLRVERPQEEQVDLSELQMTHYRLRKLKEQQLKLAEQGGDYALQPASEVGSGKPFDPEKKKLAEIIAILNDLFGADVGDDNKLRFATEVKQQLSKDEELMAQVNSHSTEQVMHGLFPKRMTDVVLDVMTDSEQWPADVRKLSMEVLDNEATTRRFALLILRMLKESGGDAHPAVR